jgi:cell wall-associated NlpC family hydrolase
MRRLLLLVGVVLVWTIGMPGPAAASSAPVTEAQRVISVASAELGHKYAFASTGPRFDCSGLVFYVFKKAGLLDRIGGGRKTVAGYYHWFKTNGTVTHSIADAQPGDILVWGRNHHTGIYVGDGYAISALVNPWGVTRHKYDWIHMKLTAVLHVQLER